jgi:hypothetical protein
MTIIPDTQDEEAGGLRVLGKLSFSETLSPKQGHEPIQVIIHIHTEMSQ